MHFSIYKSVVGALVLQIFLSLSGCGECDTWQCKDQTVENKEYLDCSKNCGHNGDTNED